MLADEWIEYMIMHVGILQDGTLINSVQFSLQGIDLEENIYTHFRRLDPDLNRLRYVISQSPRILGMSWPCGHGD
jgi:hypothetical protein